MAQEIKSEIEDPKIEKKEHVTADFYEPATSTYVGGEGNPLCEGSVVGGNHRFCILLFLV